VTRQSIQYIHIYSMFTTPHYDCWVVHRQDYHLQLFGRCLQFWMFWKRKSDTLLNPRLLIVCEWHLLHCQLNLKAKRAPLYSWPHHRLIVDHQALSGTFAPRPFEPFWCTLKCSIILQSLSRWYLNAYILPLDRSLCICKEI